MAILVDDLVPAALWAMVELAVLDRLGEQGRFEWSRAGVDTMSVCAKRGGTTWAQTRSIVASPGPSCTWHADKAYDSAADRAWLRRRGIDPAADRPARD